MSDDDAARQRHEDARIASEMRIRGIVDERIDAKRLEMWRELGYDISDPDDRGKLKRFFKALEILGIDIHNERKRDRSVAMVAWAYRSYDLSATASKRALLWGGFVISSLAALFEMARTYADWRKLLP